MKMKRILESVFVLVLGFCFINTRPATVQERYMDRFKNIAMEEMKRSGIPASIKMAQGIMESMAGRSELAVNANNHFGIKCKANWQGGTYLYVDDDRDSSGNLVQSCFRLYQSPEDSYYDHSEFLKNRSRYKSLFSLPAHDYQGWANGLKRAGYATDPNYATKLIQTIEKYNLYVLDQEVMAAQLADLKAPSKPETKVETPSDLSLDLLKLEAEKRVHQPTQPMAVKSPQLIQRPVVKPGIPVKVKQESNQTSRKKGKGKRKKLYK